MAFKADSCSLVFLQGQLSTENMKWKSAATLSSELRAHRFSAFPVQYAFSQCPSTQECPQRPYTTDLTETAPRTGSSAPGDTRNPPDPRRWLKAVSTQTGGMPHLHSCLPTPRFPQTGSPPESSLAPSHYPFICSHAQRCGQSCALVLSAIT